MLPCDGEVTIDVRLRIHERNFEAKKVRMNLLKNKNIEELSLKINDLFKGEPAGAQAIILQSQSSSERWRKASALWPAIRAGCVGNNKWKALCLFS